MARMHLVLHRDCVHPINLFSYLSLPLYRRKGLGILLGWVYCWITIFLIFIYSQETAFFILLINEWFLKRGRAGRLIEINRNRFFFLIE